MNIVLNYWSRILVSFWSNVLGKYTVVENAPKCTQNDTFNSLDDTNILTGAPLIKR